MLFKRTPEQEETGRPWQPDLDRVQQTLQDVLQAISHLSGVDLPGTDHGSQRAGESLPKLDANTLKDRIRNDLEAFSITTAAELAKKAEEQARTALGAVENEMTSKVEQVAGEFREKLQARLDPEEIEVDVTQKSRERVTELVQARTDEFAQWVWLMCKGTGTPIPLQIERLLEPYVEEASAKFEGAFRQKVQDLLGEQEKSAQERFQGTLSSFEGKMGALEQTAQQICDRNAEAVAKSSSDRLNAASEEVAKNFAGRIQDETEGSLGRFRTRLEEMAAASQESLRGQEDQRAENFRQRLDGLTGEVHEKTVAEISGRITQTAADVIESSVQHLHQQTQDSLEHSREEIKGFVKSEMEGVRQQVHELGWSVHQSLSDDAARVAESLQGLDQELAGVRERHVAASHEQLSGVIQASMASLKERIQQIADMQMQEINQHFQESQERAAAEYESRLREVNEGQYKDMLGSIQQGAGEASSKVAEEVRATAESVIQELTERMNASASALREEAVQTTSRIESSVQTSLETYRQQLAQMGEAGLERQRKSISGSMAELNNRLKQAANLLVLSD